MADSDLTRRSPLDRLTDELGRLPGIGRKSAEKLAWHLLRATPDEAHALADAIRDVKEHMFACSVCFNLTEQDPCPLCCDANRDRTRICVIEQPRDLHAIEQTGTYSGLYHVLTGRLAPLEGMTADDLTVGPLRDRIACSLDERTDTDEATGLTRVPVAEVILATNPDFEGDGTAWVVQEALHALPVTVTRLARGIPQGASIEYVSSAILSDAMRGRQGLAATDGNGEGQSTPGNG